MSLFAIADTHLSFSCDKPMNIFKGWQDFEKRLEKNWNSVVGEDDFVVIPGDISWGMNIDETLEDFRFLDRLNGTKIIMKGNHDYWWSTKSKTEKFFAENEINSVKVLFNNAYRVGDFTVCGTRGWFFDCEKKEDEKVLLREAGRLKMSLEEAEKLGGEPIIFLHYPPVSLTQTCSEIYDIVISSGAKRCYYGHLHGPSSNWAFRGERDGVNFDLVSADFLEFCPKLLAKF
ncbi:MAG: metallophosphoesterase [Clostridia bacterium]|nr:metallophosphoesterase [Clostridia bacterium]